MRPGNPGPPWRVHWGFSGYAESGGMRFGALLFAALLAQAGQAGARADGAPSPAGCLSPQDMRETVASKEVVAPAAAIRTARQAVPKAEVVRAFLCRRGEGLVYVITTLGRDGRFTQVRIDAASGKVAGVH